MFAIVLLVILPFCGFFVDRRTVPFLIVAAIVRLSKGRQVKSPPVIRSPREQFGSPTFETCQPGLRRRVPHAERLVNTSGVQLVATAAKRHSHHGPFMAG